MLPDPELEPEEDELDLELSECRNREGHLI